MLDCDWSSARVVSTSLERDHVDVQRQSTFYFDSCDWSLTLRTRQSGALKWILLAFSTVVEKLMKYVPKFSVKRCSRRRPYLEFCCFFD